MVMVVAMSLNEALKEKGLRPPLRSGVVDGNGLNEALKEKGLRPGERAT